MNKWYMHNPAPVLENDTYKLIKKDHLILARRPDFIVINKKKKRRTCKIVEFVVPADNRIKLKECEEKDKYHELAKELKKKKKTAEQERDNCINCDWCSYDSNKRTIKGTGGLGSWRTSRDYPKDSIIENGQNTEESSGYLGRLAVT